LEKFKIINTGSDGNCFTFGALMIDLGISYTKVKSSLEGISHILLTHIHGDHFKTTTIRKVFVNHENITFVCGEWLRENLLKIGVDEDRILVVEFGKVYDLEDYKISPVLAYHDVENCGYRIMKDTYKHFHITDTFSLEGISASKYDSASIECNHDYRRALELIKEAKENNEFSHLKGAINSHLAVHKSIEFCKENKIKKLIPIHIGNSTKKEVIESLKMW
jgi:phosphoribosyl 1,2-cyclic phosphodiesterase